MWQEEQGFLELFLAYFEQYKNNLAYGKKHREFLLDILLCHERVIRSCGLLPELDDYRSNIVDEMPILEPQVIVVEHCDEEDELGSSMIITKMEMLPQEDSVQSSGALFGLEPPCKDSSIAEDGKNGLRISNSTQLRCKLEMVDSDAQNNAETSELVVDDSRKVRGDETQGMETSRDFVDFEGPNCLDQPPIFHQSNDSTVEDTQERMPSPASLRNIVNNARYYASNDDLDSYSSSQPPAKKAALEVPRSDTSSAKRGVGNIPSNSVSGVPSETPVSETGSVNASYSSSQTTTSVTTHRRSYICSQCKRLFRTQELFKRHPCVIAYERGLSNGSVSSDGAQNNVFPERDTFVSKIQTERNHQQEAIVPLKNTVTQSQPGNDQTPSTQPLRNTVTQPQPGNSQTPSTQPPTRTTLNMLMTPRNLPMSLAFSNLHQNNLAGSNGPLYLLRTPGTPNAQVFSGPIPGTQTDENTNAIPRTQNSLVNHVVQNVQPLNSVNSVLPSRYPPTQLSTQTSMNLIGQQRPDQAPTPSNQTLPDFNAVNGDPRSKAADPSQTSLPATHRYQNMLLSPDNSTARFQQQFRQFNNFQVDNRQTFCNQPSSVVQLLPFSQQEQQQLTVQVAPNPAQNQQRQGNNSILLFSPSQQQEMTLPFRNQEQSALNMLQNEQSGPQSRFNMANIQASNQEAMDLSRNQIGVQSVTNIVPVQTSTTVSTSTPTQNQQLSTQSTAINQWNPKICESSLQEDSTINTTSMSEWNQRAHEKSIESNVRSNLSLLNSPNQVSHGRSTPSFSQAPDDNRNKTPSPLNKRTRDGLTTKSMRLQQTNSPSDTMPVCIRNDQRVRSEKNSFATPVTNDVITNQTSASQRIQKPRETSVPTACVYNNLAPPTASIPQRVREATAVTPVYTSQTNPMMSRNKNYPRASAPATSVCTDRTTITHSATQRSQRAHESSVPTTSVYTDLTIATQSVSQRSQRTRESVATTTSVHTNLTRTTPSVSQRSQRAREASVPTSVYTDLSTVTSPFPGRSQRTRETTATTSVFADLTRTTPSMSQKSQRTREEVAATPSVYADLSTTTPSSISRKNHKTRELSIPTSMYTDLSTPTSSVSQRIQRVRENYAPTSQLYDNQLAGQVRSIRNATSGQDDTDPYNVSHIMEESPFEVLPQNKKKEGTKSSNKHLYDVLPLRCRHCEREFNRVIDRRKHEKTHDARRKCSGCGKDYARPSSLRAHESKCNLFKLRNDATTESVTVDDVRLVS